MLYSPGKQSRLNHDDFPKENAAAVCFEKQTRYCCSFIIGISKFIMQCASSTQHRQFLSDCF